MDFRKMRLVAGAAALAACLLAASGYGLRAENVNYPSLVKFTAAAAGTVNGADMPNGDKTCAHVQINISAITGGSTLVGKIQGKDPGSGVYYDLLASASLNATGFTLLTVCPAGINTANVQASNFVPRTWRVVGTVGGAGTVTATIGVALNH
jgi:hypothetical protein